MTDHSWIFSLDALAFAWLLICWAGYSCVTKYTDWGRGGLVGRLDQQRMLWMQEMALRELRMVDAQLLNAIASGNAFFASTSVFVVAGLVAALGTVGNVLHFLKPIPFLSDLSILEVELKVGLMIAIFIYAFFKFAWAYRLSLSAAVLVGATPEYKSKNKKTCLRHGESAGDMIVLVGRHSTAGLRTLYFGMAVLSWFIHPLAFMIVTAWVVLVLYRREYRSNALGALRRIT